MQWSARFDIHQGDNMDVLPTLPAESIDSMVTDPPAGITFMGKAWDSHSRYEPRTAKGKAVLDGATLMGLEPWEAGFVSFTTDWSTEAFRVLKPGAHALVWALPRTSDLTELGLRAAGFEIRDVVTHLFGSGFPKSLDVSAGIDQYLFAKWLEEHRPKAKRFFKRLWACDPEEMPLTPKSHRERWPRRWCFLAEIRWGPLPGKRRVVGEKEQRNPYIGSDGLQFRDAPDYTGQTEVITAPGSEEAARFDGFGTALKPSSEHWILCRKPLGEDTVAGNVLKHGTGALNIDACRVATSDSLTGGNASVGKPTGVAEGWDRPWMHDEARVEERKHEVRERVAKAEAMGRWPSNLVLTHHPDCQRVGTKTVASDRHDPAERGAGGLGTAGHKGQTGLEEQRLTEETVDAWECVDGCPVNALDEQSGIGKSKAAMRGTRGRHDAGVTAEVERRKDYTDSVRGHEDEGGASRFFPQFAWTEEDINTALFLYCAKASRSERNAKLDALEARELTWSNGDQNPGSFQADGTNRLVKNSHPTVKSIALMRWLLRLITPPGGTALDPFLGSGTTMKAAIEEGFNCIGIEREADYVAIAKARMHGDQLRFC